VARHTEAKCRLCRREGTKLFLKGTRCFTAKCAVTRREAVPGMHSFRRGKPSQYCNQMREKQKVKRYYGMRERPFVHLFHEAERTPGNTGEALLIMLERRLDNVIYLAGFATGRSHARQLVVHGHFNVNGRRVDIPSYLVAQDDLITVRGTDKMKALILANREMSREREVPAWISIVEEPPTISVRTLPGREDISVETREQMVVEILSR
jgi:small subunit ribosomal protein S4